MALQFTLTTAGKAAIVNANHTGTNPIVITQVAIGSGSWVPTAAATALNTEIKRLTAMAGQAVAADTIHVTASDSSADTYSIREVGLYTAGGVLLAVYAQPDPILTKAAATVALLAADLVITDVPANSVTVGNTNFNYPQATETVKGVAEIATTAEAQTGTDDERFLTPKKLQEVTSTEERKGVARVATAAEVEAGLSDELMITPKKLSSIVKYVMMAQYPVGEILMTHREGNPNTWLGFGTWTRYGQGRALVGYSATDDDFKPIDKTGGSKSVTLTVGQLPSHGHTVNPPETTTSSAGAHSHKLANTDSISQNATNLSSGQYLAATSNGNADQIYNLKGSSTLPTVGNSESAGAHSHTVDITEFNSGATGSGEPVNNLQPYITVYLWQRTA